MQRHASQIAIVAAVALISAVATPLAAATAPSSDGSDFSCRASAVRAVSPPYPGLQPSSVEPLIANKGESHCADGSAQTGGALTVGPAAAETARVSTDVTPDDPSSGSAPEGASASSTVQRTTIAGLPVPIEATMLSADAAFTCAAGQPVGTSSSKVGSLTIGGVPVAIPPRDNYVVRLPPWDAAVLTFNQVIVDPTRITRRALFVDFNGNTGLPDIAISEAIVGFTGNPCAAPAPALTTPGSTTATPAPTTAPAAPAQPRPPAQARLKTVPSHSGRRGSNRCVRSPLTARVVGLGIYRVTFTLDGKPWVKDGSAPFQTRIKPRALGPGVHRLRARVFFRGATGASPRTLKFSFRRCASAARPR